MIKPGLPDQGANNINYDKPDSPLKIENLYEKKYIKVYNGAIECKHFEMKPGVEIKWLNYEN